MSEFALKPHPYHSHHWIELGEELEMLLGQARRQKEFIPFP